ncbi:molybdenum cofactor guanylyltransferase [[Eubacterium] cellulosolvens]
MALKTAIILAGGAGRRFQGFTGPSQERDWKNKALIEIDHVPAIIHILQRIEQSVNEVIIVTDTASRKEQYQRLLQKYGFENQIYIDEKGEDKSPLLGMKTGLKYAKGTYCLILPCDAPFPNPQVVDLLFTKAKGFNSTIPIWENGYLEPLFAVYRRKSMSRLAEVLYSMARRRPDDLIRASSNNHFISIYQEIAPLDPLFSSFTNINYPGDLTDSSMKKTVPGPIKKSFSFSAPSLSLIDWKKIENELNIQRQENLLTQAKILHSLSKKLFQEEVFYWAAIFSEQSYKTLSSITDDGSSFRGNSSLLIQMEESLINAKRFYEKETQKYRKKDVAHLVAHAEKDAQWCKQELSTLKRRLK